MAYYKKKKQEKNKVNTFKDDFQFISERIGDSLNIFEETIVDKDKLVTMYGNREVIALIIGQKDDDTTKNNNTLRLRTKTMAAQWDFVPIGFSKINNSKGLLADIKKAAKVNKEKNCIWYLDRMVKECVGDCIEFSAQTSCGKAKNLYKIDFKNGCKLTLTLEKNDKPFMQNREVSEIFYLANKDGQPVGNPMNINECMIVLSNIAMQADKRISEFIKRVHARGGKAKVTPIYRTKEESYDGAKAFFPNGYAMKLEIINETIRCDLIGLYDDKNYALDIREFDKIEHIYGTIIEIANLPQFKPEHESCDEQVRENT